MAIQIDVMQRHLNSQANTIAEREQKIKELEAENKRLQQIVGEAKQEVDILMAEAETGALYRQQLWHDANRFIQWFTYGDNDDEQLLELKRQKALDPKSVTLDMWRTALDAAMEKKKHALR